MNKKVSIVLLFKTNNRNGMKTLVSNIQSALIRISENVWPGSPKQLKPARVAAPGTMHPAAVQGGSRNYPPR
jgi:hypothetical protein